MGNKDEELHAAFLKTELEIKAGLLKPEDIHRLQDQYSKLYYVWKKDRSKLEQVREIIK